MNDESNARSLLESLTGERSLLNGVIPDPVPAVASATIFALGSCQYAAGFIDAPVAYRSVDRLAQRIEGDNPPRFVVLTGDQVYVDATAGLFDASQGDDRYRLPYERWLRQPPVRNVLRQLPSFMLLDDHEINDNWEPPDDVAPPNEMVSLDEGIESYFKYQRGYGPPPPPVQPGPPTLPPVTPSRRDFTFDFDGFRFFMLDTRTDRQPRSAATAAAAQLLDAAQMGRLETWLTDNANDRPKFIVAPSILLPRHRRALQWDNPLSALNSDGWDGYQRSLQELLALIARREAQTVVFLSGDEHRGCITEIDVTSASGTTHCHSIHSAGLYSPFLFANSLQEDFSDAGFGFSNTPPLAAATVNYQCTMTSRFPAPAQDACTLISVFQESGAWRVTAEFANGIVENVI